MQPQSVQLRNQHAREMIKTIEKYYSLGVFQYDRQNGDYVTLCIGKEEFTAPASSALLVAQCAAKDTGFTGILTVEYCDDPNGNPYVNEFYFTNGTITNVHKLCSYTIYGQDRIFRQLGIR